MKYLKLIAITAMTLTISACSNTKQDTTWTPNLGYENPTKSHTAYMIKYYQKDGENMTLLNSASIALSEGAIAKTHLKSIDLETAKEWGVEEEKLKNIKEQNCKNQFDIDVDLMTLAENSSKDKISATISFIKASCSNKDLKTSAIATQLKGEANIGKNQALIFTPGEVKLENTPLKINGLQDGEQIVLIHPLK